MSITPHTVPMDLHVNEDVFNWFVDDIGTNTIQLDSSVCSEVSNRTFVGSSWVRVSASKKNRIDVVNGKPREAMSFKVI